MQQLTRYRLTSSASRGSPAIAELLVTSATEAKWNRETYVADRRLVICTVQDGDWLVDNFETDGIERHRCRRQVTADVDGHVASQRERRRRAVDVRLQLDVVVDRFERRRPWKKTVQIIASHPCLTASRRIQTDFLPHDAMPARCMLLSCVRPSVCHTPVLYQNGST